MFKLSKRSSQLATRSSELELKPRADWSTSPGTLCSHWLMYCLYELYTKSTDLKRPWGDENGSGNRNGACDDGLVPSIRIGCLSVVF